MLNKTPIETKLLSTLPTGKLLHTLMDHLNMENKMFLEPKLLPTVAIREWSLSLMNCMNVMFNVVLCKSLVTLRTLVTFFSSILIIYIFDNF